MASNHDTRAFASIAANRDSVGRREFANGNAVEVKADAARTGGSFALIEGTHQPETGPPLHIHDDVDEALYVLEGEYTILAGDEVFKASEGDVVFLPRGLPHRFVCTSGGRMLLLYVPGGFEGYFAERAREEAASSGVLSASQLDAIGRRYGMRLAGGPQSTP